MKPRRFQIWSWTSLRSLGNSAAVRISAVFPFIGYLIIFNDQVKKYLTLTALETTTRHGDLFSSLWELKLYFLYFGLLSLGIGSFIYQARCPYIVKKHADWSSYVIVDGPAMSMQQVLSLGKVLRAQIEPPVDREDLDNIRVYFMQRWYAEQSDAMLFSRIAVGILFWLGLFLVAVPSTLSAVKIFDILTGHS